MCSFEDYLWPCTSEHSMKCTWEDHHAPDITTPLSARTNSSPAPNILSYLGPRLSLSPPSDAPSTYHIAQLCLTALDLSNEAHDTHHPIAVMQYYEDQKPAALAKSTDFRTNRIPKFLSYFERVLKGNVDEGKGKYLVGDKLTYADTTLWQVLDGLKFAFPKEMEAREGEFVGLFGKEGFYQGVKEVKGIREYLGSERRQKYSMGIYRYYAELDRQ